MQLDQTHVVVRLRTVSEIGDLTLIMIRRYPSALFIGFALGAFAWALMDLLVLGWIPFREASYGLDDEEAFIEIVRYMSWMALLVVLQAPAAGVLATLYLGQAVFEHRPPWQSVRSEAKRQFSRWFWKLGILRMAFPPVVMLALRWGQPASIFFDVVIPIVLLISLTIVRGARPFLPEILLLEQCPLRGSENVITVSRRSKSLHSPISSDLSGRFFSVSITLFILAMSVLYTFLWIRGIATGKWSMMDLFVLLVIYPLSLWLIAGVSVVVRMLNYLDARIRLEGWEVELAVRAEALRQFGEGDGLSHRGEGRVGVPASDATATPMRDPLASSEMPVLAAEVAAELPGGPT
ncbi:hypothetical protein Pla22_00630 [Rubripirellula amarantea]|uniref:Uncharacterized protein n=1 Tax=Rubripirellula amarantea TaxID=2527999 RepID=A0A5C5WQK5_9BACT|nr:hypothetical protein [Rubripirellula amarantea]TWT52439.1 hypothetical protein Pla22_00630 [Rubripirellula amarantea]